MGERVKRELVFDWMEGMKVKMKTVYKIKNDFNRSNSIVYQILGL